MSAQKRYRQIFEERAAMLGGLQTGGYPRGRRGRPPGSKNTPGFSSSGSVASRRRKGGASKAAPRKRNPWVSFLKRYAKENGMNYSQALKDPRASRAYHSGR